MSQYLQEKTCVGIFSLHPSVLQLYLNKTPLQGFRMNNEKFLKNIYFEKYRRAASLHFTQS